MLGWVQGPKPKTPGSASSGLDYHDNGFGSFPAIAELARNANYDTLAAKAPAAPPKPISPAAKGNPAPLKGTAQPTPAGAPPSFPKAAASPKAGSSKRGESGS
jgi:hypothetical protein